MLFAQNSAETFQSVGAQLQTTENSRASFKAYHDAQAAIFRKAELKGLWNKYALAEKAFRAANPNEVKVLDLINLHINNIDDALEKTRFVEYLLTTTLGGTNNVTASSSAAPVSYPVRPDLFAVLKRVGISATPPLPLTPQPLGIQTSLPRETVVNVTQLTVAASLLSLGDTSGATSPIPHSKSNEYTLGASASHSTSPASPTEDNVEESREETNPLLVAAARDLSDDIGVSAPVSPDNEKIKLFQEWICTLEPSKIKDFNRWCLRDDKRTTTDEWINNTFAPKTDRKKQKAFIRWFDVKQKAIFDYYLTRVVHAKTISHFNEWQNKVYPQLIQNLKDILNTKKYTLKEFKTLVVEAQEKIKTELQNVFAKFDKANIETFYNVNITEDASTCVDTFYERWLSEQCWDWQKKFFNGDAEDNVSHIALLTLNFPEETAANSSGMINQKNNQLKKALDKKMARFTVIDTDKKTGKEIKKYTVLYNPVATTMNDPMKDLVNKLQEQHGIQVFFKTQRDESQSNNPVHSAWNTLEEGSPDHDGPSDVSRLTMTAENETVENIHSFKNSKGKKLSSYENEEPQELCQLYTGDQQKLFSACLTENRALLEQWQKDNSKSHKWALRIAIGGYWGEVFFSGFAFVTGVATELELLEMGGVQVAEGSAAYMGLEVLNAALAILIFAANVTYDPWADTEASEKNVVLTKESLLYSLVIKPGLTSPLKAFATLCFLGFATGGILPEFLPLDELGLYSDGTDAVSILKNITYWGLAVSLGISGYGYYFGYNFGDLGAGLLKSFEKLMETSRMVLGGTSKVRAVASMALLHQVLSVVERAFRIAYGPFYVSKTYGASDRLAYSLAGLVAAGTLVVAMPTRALKAYNSYYPEKITPLQRIKAENAFQQSLEEKPLTKRLELLADPSTALLIGIVAVVPMLLMDALNIAPLYQSVMMLAVGTLIAASLISAFAPAARQQAVNAIAHGKFDIAYFSGTVCLVDQAFRVLSMLFTSKDLAPEQLDSHTAEGHLGIVALLSVEIFLSFSGYLYQAEKVTEAHRTLLDTFMESETGQGCMRRLEDCKSKVNACYTTASSTRFSGTNIFSNNGIKSSRSLSYTDDQYHQYEERPSQQGAQLGNVVR